VLRIEALDVSDEVVEKLERKHDVRWHEVEEAVSSDERHVRRGREGLYEGCEAGQMRGVVSSSSWQTRATAFGKWSRHVA
jgi:hypothetical protein